MAYCSMTTMEWPFGIPSDSLKQHQNFLLLLRILKKCVFHNFRTTKLTPVSTLLHGIFAQKEVTAMDFRFPKTYLHEKPGDVFVYFFFPQTMPTAARYPVAFQHPSHSLLLSHEANSLTSLDRFRHSEAFGNLFAICLRDLLAPWLELLSPGDSAYCPLAVMVWVGSQIVALHLWHPFPLLIHLNSRFFYSLSIAPYIAAHRNAHKHLHFSLRQPTPPSCVPIPTANG